MTLNDPPVTLWFLETGREFRASQICRKGLNVDQYCRIYQAPCSEMLSRPTAEVTLPEALADELVKITVAADWSKQYKRPLMVGDVFSIGPEHWVYCTTHDQDIFQQAGIPTIPLKAWNKIAIAKIEKKDENLAIPAT